MVHRLIWRLLDLLRRVLLISQAVLFVFNGSAAGLLCSLEAIWLVFASDDGLGFPFLASLWGWCFVFAIPADYTTLRLLGGLSTLVCWLLALQP